MVRYSATVIAKVWVDRFIIIHVHKKRTYIKARKEIWYWKLAINCSGEKKSRCCNESSVLNTETMWKTLFICIGAQNPKKTEINTWKKNISHSGVGKIESLLKRFHRALRISKKHKIPTIHVSYYTMYANTFSGLKSVFERLSFLVLFFKVSLRTEWGCTSLLKFRKCYAFTKAPNNMKP